jgi:AhpD family alkylhydroperoxidase
MKTVQVFDPAMCCSTGVCGVDVDQQLVSFAADVQWLKQHGATIERFNLAQQPMVFAEHQTVKSFLETDGQDGLPIILVDGDVKMTGRYPTRDELVEWTEITVEPSIFTDQVAELVAIGAAIASNCEPCFTYHYDLARKLGVSDADMLRAVELAQKVKETPGPIRSRAGKAPASTPRFRADESRIVGPHGCATSEQLLCANHGWQ